MATDLPVPGRSGDQQVRHRRKVGHVRLAVNRLAERERQLRVRPLVHLRLQQLAQRDLLARVIRNLDADRRLARDAIDEHRLGLHREAEIVGEAGDFSVLHAGVRLELECRDDRTGMNLRDRAFDGELAALLLEQARAFHQLALVDLALGLRRIQQRQRRNRERADPPRRPRLGIGERQRRVLDRLRPLGHDRRRGDLRPARAGWRSATDARAARARASAKPPRDATGGGAGSSFLACLASERLALPRAAPLVEPAPERAEHPRAARPADLRRRREHPSERKLRRKHDREEQQRQDDDDRAGAVQVLRHPRREPLAEIAAGAKRLARHVDAAEREAQQRADAGEEQARADELRVLRVERAAPEVVPAEDRPSPPEAGTTRSPAAETTAPRETRRRGRRSSPGARPNPR